jgi:general secretion pathway protein I
MSQAPSLMREALNIVMSNHVVIAIKNPKGLKHQLGSTACGKSQKMQLLQPLIQARGFTLIEILVALAIVAVTLGAGIKAAGALTNNALRVNDMSAAQWCADNQLTALKLASQFPDVGESEFTCQQMGQDYTGRLIVRPTPNPNFRRTDAQIFDEQGQPLLKLSTILPRY